MKKVGWWRSFTFDAYLAAFILVGYVVAREQFVPLTAFRLGNWAYWVVFVAAIWRLVTYLRRPRPEEQRAWRLGLVNFWFPVLVYGGLWVVEHLITRVA
ncbi:hypothetical protein [Lacticaseibacillus kribbianus]|uniref:hypothetical protein n=1 Tax=Lacticaseibacillus kribbianus TaxID=2926292 RepID=UPI001CD5DCCD|nr:hypothetical protein [Lacticaseibacillus kribbianus]